MWPEGAEGAALIGAIDTLCCCWPPLWLTGAPVVGENIARRATNQRKTTRLVTDGRASPPWRAVVSTFGQRQEAIYNLIQVANVMQGREKQSACPSNRLN